MYLTEHETKVVNDCVFLLLMAAVAIVAAFVHYRSRRDGDDCGCF